MCSPQQSRSGGWKGVGVGLHKRVAAYRASARLAVARTAVAPLAVALTLVALANADGGYFTASWNVAALGFSWAAILALVISPGVARDRFALATAAGLTGLMAWIAASALWSTAPPETMLEVQRAAVYVSGILLVFVVCTKTSVDGLVSGVLAGTTVVSMQALAVRLFPGTFGTAAPRPFDSGTLAEPLGYSNALGSIAAIGLLLAVGSAARARTISAQAAAAASGVVLISALTLTFSRGAWLGLAVGAIAMITVDPRRVDLFARSLPLLPFLAAATLLAARGEAVVDPTTSAGDAASEGRALALAIVALAALASLVPAAVAMTRNRLTIGDTARRRIGSMLVAGTACAIVLVVVRAGGPVALGNNAFQAFRTPPPSTAGPRDRLLSLSAARRDKFWHVAWESYRDHPATGSGAGSFRQVWLERRQSQLTVKDAHSLYLETLAELGPIGLALLLVAFATPLAAAIRVRHHRLVPLAVGAYAAYLTHAGVDWLWEMPVVTVAALACAASIVLAGVEAPRRSPLLRRSALTIAMLVAALAFIGLIGNGAARSSLRALNDGELVRAEALARRATTWTPWASQPWVVRSRIEFARGDARRGTQSLRNAIAHDPDNWELWLRLARVVDGPEAQRALAQAERLNPQSPIVRFASTNG